MAMIENFPIDVLVNFVLFDSFLSTYYFYSYREKFIFFLTLPSFTSSKAQQFTFAIQSNVLRKFEVPFEPTPWW